MKGLISILLTMALTVSGGPVMAEGGGLLNFRSVYTYEDGQFSDVAAGAWYSDAVAAVYEQGLMGGVGKNRFNAAGEISVAQAVVLAARLHKIYNTGSGEFESGGTWYGPYLDYARENGIIAGEPALRAAATRAQFADILSRALPEEVFAPINDVPENAIPDVKTGDEYAESIYMLYRAGVVTGSGTRGAFRPRGTVTRAEAAAIVTRMTDPERRQSLSLSLEYSGPDLTPQPEMDDSFFENSAILGNSLVDGLRFYSNMKTLSYFCATSMSVFSATRSWTQTLKNGQKGTLVQALCQDPHDKIYIELGINEIGGELDYFIELYGGMIDSIAEAEPDADIYILSILPVTKRRSDTSSQFNMTNVNMYNEALRQLAEDKRCYYMDVCSALQGDDGYLPSKWSFDGVHLYAQYYAIWENCMRTLY